MNTPKKNKKERDKAFLLIQEGCDDDDIYKLFVDRHKNSIQEFTEKLVGKGVRADRITDEAFALLRNRIGDQESEESAKRFLLIAVRNASRK